MKTRNDDLMNGLIREERIWERLKNEWESDKYYIK